MVSLDSSIIPAIVIFLSVVVALNYLLFQPLMRVQKERESRTSGVMVESRNSLQHYSKLMDDYQAALRNGRMETYRRQEEVRSEAMKHRVDAIDRARKSAEKMVIESRDRIRVQVGQAKVQLSDEAKDLARGIASAVLRRSA